MTDDRSLERAARSWLEEGPTRASDRTVEAALSRIQNVSQERDLRIPWRLPTMNPNVRLAGVAVLALLVVGAAAFIFRPTSNVGPPATSSTPIANGRYAATPIAVADIQARLAADTTLSADEKAEVAGRILKIEGATTLRVEIEIEDALFKLSYGRDEAPMYREPAWTLTVVAPGTIGVTSAGETRIREFDVTHAGDSFTLEAVTPASSNVEAFVRSVLFETAPFSRIAGG